MYSPPVPTLPGARVSVLTVAAEWAQVLTRLQQLRNLAAQGDAPAVARVDLRTLTVTLETQAEELPSPV